MIDGTGMCGGCRVTVGDEIRFACVDGPLLRRPSRWTSTRPSGATRCMSKKKRPPLAGRRSWAWWQTVPRRSRSIKPRQAREVPTDAGQTQRQDAHARARRRRLSAPTTSSRSTRATRRRSGDVRGGTLPALPGRGVRRGLPGRQVPIPDFIHAIAAGRHAAEASSTSCAPPIRCPPSAAGSAHRKSQCEHAVPHGHALRASAASRPSRALRRRLGARPAGGQGAGGADALARGESRGDRLGAGRAGLRRPAGAASAIR